MDTNENEIYVGKNRIYLSDNNILYYINNGGLDEKEALESVEAMRMLTEKSDDEVNFIINLNNGEKTSTKARKILREFTENEVQGKIAFIGLHPVAKVLASFFIGITRKEDMRFFKSEKEAIIWFNE